jgi:hypothetical protein
MILEFEDHQKLELMTELTRKGHEMIFFVFDLQIKLLNFLYEVRDSRPRGAVVRGAV